MRAKIKIDLIAMKNYTFTSSMSLSITEINSFERWNDIVCLSENIKSITLLGTTLTKQLMVFQEGAVIADPVLVGNDLVTASVNNDYIVIDFNIADDDTDTFEKLISFFKTKIISILEIEEEDKTTLILHRLNDERDHINKNLINVGVLFGNFKAPLGIKRIDIDIEDYEIEDIYNYVYIPKLKRYYYVTDIQFMNNKFTRLILQEDVLMSWRDLIRAQKAYVTRYGGNALNLLNDERYPVQDIPTVTYYTPTNLSTVLQFKYIMDDTTDNVVAPNVMISTFSDNYLFVDNTQDTKAPTNSGLPDIKSRRSSDRHHFLVNINEYGSVLHACINNDAPASFISSVILYPFDLSTIYTEVIGYHTAHISAGKKVLKAGNLWGDYPTDANDPTFYETAKGSSQYLVIADFRFGGLNGIPVSNDFLDRSNNSLWEIYIPFVGWVQIDINKVYNKEVLIYYSCDLDTGLSTAYIYNKTDKKVIWSGSCQIGIKLPLTTTNADELARQKQATALNLLMGVLSSTASIGIGAYTGNAVAVAGGALSLGKTIANTVNNLNMMIERAQMSYGSSDNALYAPTDVIVRKTTHVGLLSSSEQDNYYHINGYPYRKYVALSGLTADKYIEVGEIHFDAKGYDIYNTEIDEIVALLKEGVIL